jgi:hypothetical protein
MKLSRPARLAARLALLLSLSGAAGQGSFQNLGFESATLVPVPGQPPFHYFAQAFPGWTGYVAGEQELLALHNSLTLATPGFSIIDQSFVNPLGLPGGLIQGDYTAVLMSGISLSSLAPDVTLAQTGLVPAGTESLRFRAHLEAYGALGSFGVTLGGQTLSLVPVANEPNYTLYAADIHQFAGQAAELGFTSFTDRSFVGNTCLYLDSIAFSTQPVPEPGAFGLAALGALLLAGCILGRRR